MVFRRPAVQVHRLRRLLHGGAGLCVGEPGGDRRAGPAAGLSVAEFERRFVREVGVRRTLKERKNFDCVFLDAETRKCTVYEDRPRQCRTWPFWNSNLKSPEAWQQTCEVCPGSGHGKLYSIETIDRQRAAINI